MCIFRINFPICFDIFGKSIGRKKKIIAIYQLQIDRKFENSNEADVSNTHIFANS